MIKNLEIKILRKKADYKFIDTPDHGEIFVYTEGYESEFFAIAYYYFLKLKKIKIPGVSFIEIRFKTEGDIDNKVTFEISNKILFIFLRVEFTEYLKGTYLQKQQFQYWLINYILRDTFIHLNLPTQQLEDIRDELKENYWEMWVSGESGRVNKNVLCNARLHLQMTSFTFFVEITNREIKKQIFIMRMKPYYPTISYLLSKIRISGDKIILGNINQDFFSVDILTQTATVLPGAEKIIHKYSFQR